MACKKAWSLSARRRPRQRDRRQSTCNSPAAASGAPSAPWSHLLMFVVFTFFLLASSPASLVPPSPVAQPVAHALPLLTHDGARSIALILYLIGLLSSCARATGPRKARQPHTTVGDGDLAPPPAAAPGAQRAGSFTTYTCRLAALYVADCFLLWGVAGSSAAVATACGVVRLSQLPPESAVAFYAYPTSFSLILGLSSIYAFRARRRIHTALRARPWGPRDALPQPRLHTPPPRSPPWWDAAPFNEQLPRRRGSPRRRWTDPSCALARCRQGAVSSAAARGLLSALGAAQLLEPDPMENGVTKGVSGRDAIHLPVHLRRRRRADRRRARACLRDAIAACFPPKAVPAQPRPAQPRRPGRNFLLTGLMFLGAFVLVWPFLPPLPTATPSASPLSIPEAWVSSPPPWYSTAGAAFCSRPTCLWRRRSWGAARRIFKGGKLKRRSHGRYDAVIAHGTGVPYDLSFTFRHQLVIEGIEPNPGPTPGSSRARRAHRDRGGDAPSPSSSVRGGLSPSRLPARNRPARNQAWGSIGVLEMLGLRRVTALGNGHCCVYSIAHQLDFALADPMLAFNISQSDCLSLRQKAYNLLTTPSDFLSS